MRLAFVSIMNGADWAACEELWSNAALHAVRAGHEVFVSVYVRAAHAPKIAELRAAGAHIDLRSNHRRVRKWALIAKAIGTFKSLMEFRADAICISQGGTYDIARSGNMRVLRQYLQRTGTPYVLLCHCEQPPPRGGRLRRARSVLTSATVLGMLAQHLRNLSERHLAQPLPNVRIFQNPLKIIDPKPLPWPPHSTVRMACVARLEPVKGLDLLIDVLARAPWRQRDWCLTICGEGSQREALTNRVRAAHLADRIRFVGFVTEIANIWRDHHVLVMPSRFEGVPIALLEAMLCGRPVVATDVGGIREWLEDAHSGFLVSAANTSAVATALERLWEHRAELECMGLKAYQRTVAALDPNPAATLVTWLIEAAQQRALPRHPLSTHSSTSSAHEQKLVS